MRGVIAAAVAGGLASLLASFVWLAVQPTPGQATVPQAGLAIGLDADPAGNSGTLIQSVDGCVAVSQGQQFQVDVFVQDVAQLLAWEAYMSFDPGLLRVVDRDVQQFLAAVPNSNLFDISERTPQAGGHYRVGAANISLTDQASGGTGSGVLARLTLQALNPGLATLSVAPIETDAGPVRATFTAVDGSRIGDGDGDGFYDAQSVEAQVAIDRGCPSSASLASVLGDTSSIWRLLLVMALSAGVAAALVPLWRRVVR